VDLPDLEAACVEAMRAARAIIAEQLLNGQAIPDAAEGGHQNEGIKTPDAGARF
jgi:hypothetical protein